MIPDFGIHEIDHEGTKLTCKYIAPDLTFQDLMKIFDKAERQFRSGDNWSADPSKWSNARGVRAVADAILNAVYK